MNALAPTQKLLYWTLRNLCIFKGLQWFCCVKKCENQSYCNPLILLIRLRKLKKLYIWWSLEHYQRIWYIGILNILSWRTMRNGRSGIRETEGSGKTHWPPLSPLKQLIRPSCERCPLYTRREGASLSLKTGGLQEESEQTGLASFPSSGSCSLIPFVLSIFSHDFLFFI